MIHIHVATWQRGDLLKTEFPIGHGLNFGLHFTAYPDDFSIVLGAARTVRVENHLPHWLHCGINSNDMQALVELPSLLPTGHYGKLEWVISSCWFCIFSGI